MERGGQWQGAKWVIMFILSLVWGSDLLLWCPLEEPVQLDWRLLVFYSWGKLFQSLGESGFGV